MFVKVYEYHIHEESIEENITAFSKKLEKSMKSTSTLKPLTYKARKIHQSGWKLQNMKVKKIIRRRWH